MAVLPSALRGKRSLLGVAYLAWGALGCFSNQDGLAPPLDQLYYPTTLALSPKRSALYVASSDFDLQYEGATVVAVDLPRLREPLGMLLEALGKGQGSDACRMVPLIAGAELGANPNPLLNPGPCTSLPLRTFLGEKAVIGAFASGTFLASPSSPLEGLGARLFMTVRGDPSVTYFDTTDDRGDADVTGTCSAEPCLSCGQDASSRACAQSHRLGLDPSQSQRRLTLPAEPVGIAGSASTASSLTGIERQAIVAVHQTTRSASLILNRWNQLAPTLEFVLDGLAAGPTDVAALPQPALVAAARAVGQELPDEPGFLVTYRASPQIDLLRAHFDEGAAPERPYLARAGTIVVSSTPNGFDQRGIVIDGSARHACESDCAAQELACLEACLDQPVPFYVASRSPAVLLRGEVRSQVTRERGRLAGVTDSARILGQVPLTQGASQVAMGQIVDGEGRPQPRVFVVAFDTRSIFAYDPLTDRVDLTIRTGRGPQDLAFDVDPANGRAFLYIAHFTDSYLGVVDLDARHPLTFGSIFASVGTPTPPRASQ